MIRILIAEDDPTINQLVFQSLTEQGFSCTQAFSGTEAKLLLDTQPFDLLVLDLMLPGMTGEALTEDIRTRSQIPILILSAKSALEDKVGLLRGGADDYLTKPFDLEELVVRIQALLRRSQNLLFASQETLSYKDWVLETSGRTFTSKGETVELTAHEFAILELFLRHPRKVFTKQEIFESVWNQEYFVEDKTINVHISNIRAKLKKTATDTYIQTVWGIGFKLAE